MPDIKIEECSFYCKDGDCLFKVYQNNENPDGYASNKCKFFDNCNFKVLLKRLNKIK